MKHEAITITKLGQGFSYRETLTHAGRHLRIALRTDSYKDQGHAHIEILQPDLTWTTLATIEPRAMQTDASIFYERRIITAADFHKDTKQLLDEAIRLMAPAK
jgi:hypothetical protein